jgi:type IV secretion system protein TrbC
MFKNASLLQTLRPYAPAIFLLSAVLVLMLMPDLAHATDTGGDENLPFLDPLRRLKDAMSGPVAFVISLIGIVAAGAVLIFGGEMSGFLRTLVFLVLVIAIIVNASTLIEFIKSGAATIASLTNYPVGTFRVVS